MRALDKGWGDLAPINAPNLFSILMSYDWMNPIHFFSFPSPRWVPFPTIFLVSYLPPFPYTLNLILSFHPPSLFLVKYIKTIMKKYIFLLHAIKIRGLSYTHLKEGLSFECHCFSFLFLPPLLELFFHLIIPFFPFL